MRKFFLSSFCLFFLAFCCIFSSDAIAASVCPNCPGNIALYGTIWPATCEGEGGGYSYCRVCGYRTGEYTLPALGHDMQETGRKNATCTTDGYIYYGCSRCSRVEMTIIGQLAEDHTWTETSRTAATCTTAGTVNYTCSVCNEIKSESIAALDHDWDETSRTTASCLTAGSILYICSRCNKTKTERSRAMRPLILDCLSPKGDRQSNFFVPGEVMGWPVTLSAHLMNGKR